MQKSHTEVLEAAEKKSGAQEKRNDKSENEDLIQN